MIAELIADRLRNPEDMGDLLSMLILARDEDGLGLSAQELLDEVKTMLFARVPGALHPVHSTPSS